MITRPSRKVGFTAEKAAHLLLDNGWETFGIPSIITSDQGPQFIGQWWRTMCARLGIRQAYSQAYRAQANGRAEIAGKTLIGLMRKVWVEMGINWVEALPRILRMYHDMPGETGYSPFQIMFGRDRNLAGLPYEPPRQCEEATQFFDRMEALDKKLSTTLTEQHWTEMAQQNITRHTRPPFKTGDWVWVLRPQNPTVSKVDTWWVGPVKVIRRTGNSSYEVLLKPGVPHDAHMDQLKPFVTGESIELYHFQPGYHIEGNTPDEWDVDEILEHKLINGKLLFRVRWENADPQATTWEPVENFFHRYNWKFVHYCCQKGLHIDVAKHLRDKPSEEE